jgi:hypothetical protein
VNLRARLLPFFRRIEAVPKRVKKEREISVRPGSLLVFTQQSVFLYT